MGERIPTFEVHTRPDLKNKDKVFEIAERLVGLGVNVVVVNSRDSERSERLTPDLIEGVYMFDPEGALTEENFKDFAELYFRDIPKSLSRAHGTAAYNALDRHFSGGYADLFSGTAAEGIRVNVNDEFYGFDPGVFKTFFDTEIGDSVEIEGVASAYSELFRAIAGGLPEKSELRTK